jgi:flagellar motor protein MotB
MNKEVIISQSNFNVSKMGIGKIQSEYGIPPDEEIRLIWSPGYDDLIEANPNKKVRKKLLNYFIVNYRKQKGIVLTNKGLYYHQDKSISYLESAKIQNISSNNSDLVIIPNTQNTKINIPSSFFFPNNSKKLQNQKNAIVNAIAEAINALR